jgi:hypothetical protein
LLVLFVFSIVLLPLFRWLKGRGARLEQIRQSACSAVGSVRAGYTDCLPDSQPRSMNDAGHA